MSAFLPTGYKQPDTSNYMKFQEGKNKFRILGSAVVGMEYWKESKPIRKHMGEKINIGELEEDENGELKMPLHFWAFPVYNYSAERIQILEIKQKTIQSAMKALVEDEDWGDPKGYDITVNQIKASGKTSYSVTPSPSKDLDKTVLGEFQSMPLNLEALFEGKDPFQLNTEVLK